MITISLCMIVKNEEKHLARCLDHIANLVDEIIIVDTGSTDQTLEIASKYTSKIYTHPWIDDFSDARNYAFSKASMDYCRRCSGKNRIPKIPTAQTDTNIRYRYRNDEISYSL